jgi:phospholipid/cholesterol/gamma-HCH transport system permease protein
MISLIGHLGRYITFMGNLFRNREKFNVYVNRVVDECILIGIDSIFIVVIVSSFIGAVTAEQTAYNLVSPLIPTYIIGLMYGT